MEVNIICSHDFRKIIENHPKYQMDLGKRYVKKSNAGNTMDIQDRFVNKFFKENKTLIYKIGVMGGLTFYTHPNIPQDVVYIYQGDDKREERVELLDLQHEIDKTLGKLLMGKEKEEGV